MIDQQVDEQSVIKYTILPDLFAQPLPLFPLAISRGRFAEILGRLYVIRFSGRGGKERASPRDRKQPFPQLSTTRASERSDGETYKRRIYVTTRLRMRIRTIPSPSLFLLPLRAIGREARGHPNAESVSKTADRSRRFRSVDAF